MLKSKKIVYAFIFAILIFYFQYGVTIAYDSAHYMNYVNIFEGLQDWNTWDVVRGPIFPLIIFLGNFIFGKTSQGVTLLTFIFYLLTLYFYLKIVEEFILSNTKLSRKNKNVNETFIIVFTVLNPIVFGYFHCLLTEFVAINISIISCYFAYKWLKCDFFKSRIKYVLYSLFFITFVPLSWHLKQPYVSCTIFPFIISYMITVFENTKLKQIIVRTITLCLCFMTLFLSIKCWNLFLKKMEVNPLGDRNPSVMLSTQILNGTWIINVDDSYSMEDFNHYVKKTKLDKSEVKKLKHYWLKGKRFFVINTFEHGKIINSDFIYNGGDRIPLSTSISYLFKTFFNHPILLSSSYISNYLATIDIYRTELDSGGGYKNTHVFDMKFSNEISSLGYRFYNHQPNNILSITPEMYENVKNYEQITQPCPLINYFMNFLSKVYLIIYKLLFVILPFVLLVAIILRIIEKNTILKSKFNLCIILLGFSFMHVFLHVFMGALIDRYTVPAILTNFLGILCFLFCIVSKLSQKVVK